MSPSHLFIATAIFAVSVLAQQQTSVDDTSKYISINGSWTRLANQDPNLARWGNTTTLSTTKGDIISWTFTGLAVEYWGGTGPDRGPCLIELDGERQGEVSGYAAADGPSRQLFRKSSLDPLRNHTITITVSSDKPPNVCDLDRFVYIPVPTTDTPQPNAQPTTDATRSTTHRKVPTVVMLLSTPQRTPVPFSPAKNPGPIIGGVIVGTIALLGLIASVFWIRRDRRKNAAMDAEEKEREKLLVITCMEAKLNMELLLKASGFTGNPYIGPLRWRQNAIRNQ
ncbi:hypothetical protein BKA62DRAFT_101230 [Auriculariales sp. MPI-PUGE-AT-0066]|nr:hypothetical protein BKA62DRAFT_101230 [Auriculariales sp. MPI-PUGE-AT-0066]